MSDTCVFTEISGPVLTIIMRRAHKRNAVDREMATQLREAFGMFDHQDDLHVAVLWGDEGVFCAGADLTAIADPQRRNELDPSGGGSGPMGPTRMNLRKPLIAAVAGPAVAGGLELALLADMRVVEDDAYFGVFCRRWGVPLIDGGTVRLPRLIGQGHAMDMILTGRAVPAQEALGMGLANRVVPKGQSRVEAEKLAHQLAAFPQACMLADRRSAYAQWDLPLAEALRQEGQWGVKMVEQEGVQGARRFVQGQGRGGAF